MKEWPRGKSGMSWLKTKYFALSLLLITNGAIGQATNVLDLTEYRGKVVVVDFWASWCVPCRRSFPWMNLMQAKYGDDGLVFIGVSEDNDVSDANSFLDEYPAEFTIKRIYDDDEKSLAREFDVRAMPSSYIFDREGKQVARHFGFKVEEQDEYEALLVETLRK